MKLLLIIAFKLLAVAASAQTCDEVLRTTVSNFSPAKYLLGKRRVAMLGKRFDTVARGGGKTQASDSQKSVMGRPELEATQA